MDQVEQLINSRPGFDAMEPANLDKAIKINDFIYMSTGTTNAYLILTPNYRVIVNTGLGFEALTHKKVFDQVSTLPVRYILLTQGHVDHVGGVNALRTPETQVIAQQNNSLCQQDDARIQSRRTQQAYIWFQKTIDKAMALASSGQWRFSQDVPVPDLTFDQRLSIQVDGLDIELIATPGGETIDSCVIWLPAHKILFSSNLFGPLFPHFPNFNTLRGDKYRYAEPYLASLRLVRDLGAEMLITGHFDPIVGAKLIKQCLDRLEGAVEYVHRETLKGINFGEPIWKLMQTIKLPPELTVGQGYGKVSWAVRTIWESYFGWFKAQYTSELYATQPHDIYKDLVSLAGMSAVIQMGEEALNAQHPEKAQLLAEAALTFDPNDAAALRLSLAAHEALLKNAQHNFWESGWLRSQMAQLQAKLTPQPQN